MKGGETRRLIHVHLDYGIFQMKGYLDFGTNVLTPTTGFWVNKP